MSRSVFGWSLPPGAAGNPMAPWNQQEGPCAVCGKPVDDCICPECPVCGSQGDPNCYRPVYAGMPRNGHGLTRSPEQVASLAAAEAQWAADSKAESEGIARDYGHPSEDE